VRKNPAPISRFSSPEVLADLAAHLEAHNVRAVEITTTDGRLEIIAAAGTGRSVTRAAPAISPARPETTLAKAPTAGTFLPGHPLRPGSTIKAGRTVSEGETVAFVRTGHILLPVIAEKAGTVATVAAEPGTLVGYGTPLFKAKA
jgi:acetyl-CoA carboxylase biotin carboxyl carrier protein